MVARGFKSRLAQALVLIISLSFPSLACQTSGNKDTADREQEVLRTQKALVRNSLDSGKPEAALQHLRGILRQFPKDAEGHNLMGLAQLALKNPGRATHHFLTSYKLDKQPATALNLSSAYLEGGDFDKAIKVLTVMLRDKTKDAYPYRERVLHNLGFAHLSKGDMNKARLYFTDALTENPAFYPTHIELARLYEKTKRPALAALSYRKAVDYCDVCFEPVEALTRLYTKLGRPIEARRALSRFYKTEGVSAADRARAGQLLKIGSAPSAKRRG